MSLEKRNIKILGYATRDSVKAESAARNRDDLMAKNHFDYYDSDVYSYENDFKSLLHPFLTFSQYLKARYSERLGQLIGVELGGPGVNLFNGIDEEGKIFNKTVGFTLQKLDEHADTNSFTGVYHSVEEADIFLKNSNSGRSWSQVKDWVSRNGKPDFIIQRMVGPLFMIKEPKLFLRLLDRWYRLLNDEGVMFIEIPKNMRNMDYQALEKIVNGINHGGVNARLAFGRESHSFVLCIEKGKGAPVGLGEVFTKNSLK